MRRAAWTGVLFVLTTGVIAGSVLADARDARVRSVLERIIRAEEKASRDGSWGLEGEPRRHARGRSHRGPGIWEALLRGSAGRCIKDARLAARNYDIASLGRENLPGRTAEVIELRPRHPGRAAYRLSVDMEDRVPLRLEVRKDGKPIFEGRYGRGHRPPSPRGIGLEVTREVLPLSEIAAQLGSPLWVPGRRPAGFEFERAEIIWVRIDPPREIRRALPFQVPPINACLARLSYTDGMAGLSVVEFSASSIPGGMMKRFGPRGRHEGKPVAKRFADRHGAAYLTEREGTIVLVAGQLPASEIEPMIRTLERR